MSDQPMQVLGPKGQVYEVADVSALKAIEVEGEGIHGVALPREAFPEDLPAPREAPEVEGQHLVPDFWGNPVWHHNVLYGAVYDLYSGRVVYCNHYHPYGTATAVCV